MARLSARPALRPGNRPNGLLCGCAGHHDGNDPDDRNSSASLCWRSGGAGRNARPARQHKCHECALQHRQLYVAADRGPAGADGGGYADQRRFGAAHHRGQWVRRHVPDPRLSRRLGRRWFERSLRTGVLQPRPAQIIERIELLKGPGALINGIAPGGSVGGAINIVTKRAGEIPFTRLTPFFMSAGNYGLHLETSQRYGANKEWGVRFNGVGRNGEASIHDGNWRTGLGALAVDYRGERLRWTVDAISQNDDTKNFRPQIGIQTTVPFIPVPPGRAHNWYPGMVLKQRDNTIASASRVRPDSIDDGLCRHRLSRGRELPDFPDSRVTGFPPGGTDAFGNFRLINAYYDSYSKTASGNAGIRSRFHIGPVDACDQFRLYRLLPGKRQRVCRQHAGQSVPSNIYNPAPLPVVTGARLPPRKANEITFKSLAIADTMSFLNDAVLLTVGGRHQRVEQDAFSTATGPRRAATVRKR